MRFLLVVAVLVGGCASAAPAPPTHVGTREPATTVHDAHHAALAGVVVGIDPGHNGRNYTDPAYINHNVWNGRAPEACDTTGTETNAGYPEPRFTWRVARFLAADLRRKGATVVMTRHDNHGVGPCIDRRAQILNRASSDVALDIHADGGPASGRGFAILLPVKSKANRHIVAASAVLGRVVRHEMLTMTGMPTSTYDGRRGLAYRDDLAGLNLATQPKVLIECGNMRNARDAHKLVSNHFQRRLAAALTAAVVRFLHKTT